MTAPQDHGSVCAENCGWKAWGKGPLRRSRSRWEDAIKMDVQEWGVDWLEVAQVGARWWALGERNNEA